MPAERPVSSCRFRRYVQMHHSITYKPADRTCIQCHIPITAYTGYASIAVSNNGQQYIDVHGQIELLATIPFNESSEPGGGLPGTAIAIAAASTFAVGGGVFALVRIYLRKVRKDNNHAAPSTTIKPTGID